MTIDDLPTGQPLTTRRLRRGSFHLLIVGLLGLCASPLAMAQSVNAAQPEIPHTVSSDVVTVTSSVPTTVATGVPGAIAASAAPVPAGQSLQAAPAPLTVAIPASALAPASAVPAAATTSTSSLREKATQAAAATLTALLPRLAASDTVPVMDRSAMLAGDLSRLLSNYDLTGAATAPDQNDVGKIQSILQRALTLLGTPYRWGGTDPDSGLDCSGLVGYVFRTALGVDLPRVSRDMAANDNAELIKDRGQLRQGDLVFFGARGRVNHVGIYVGEGRFLHSPSTGKDVRVDTLTSGYWGGRFMQARRVSM